ncbi:MotA/TolQ/ExbB proton channel family protein [Ketobacter alkanivorans]|uniref:Flagellar motor protein MotA n=1 Tax=Ketobacter alkanivorans TaxID=1917421 RepID=A0A2K9LK23_9GAMM|nr:MotA/TolQ/ExbB proton channel family protein [Ketobacter alkanivorans]AUM12521.1 flagellar motor protein MotA [Ketobacter alkanivorans]
MIHGLTLGLLHHVVSWLLYPVLIALAVCLLMVLWECGSALAERFGALTRMQTGDALMFEHYAVRRLERVDLLARSGPILGLMGTLIPLGPGLSAMGSGNIEILATAMTVAFDTTVLGLFVGLLGYVLGRVRRRWYEACLQNIEQRDAI